MRPTRIYRQVMIFIILTLCFLSCNLNQGAAMDDRFYYNWLFVNVEKDKYKEPLNKTPLESTEYKEATESIKLEPGYFSLYGNRLRNGNCYQNFTLNKDDKFEIKQIADNEVIQVLQSNDKLLAGHPGFWAIYDSKTKTQIKSGNWTGVGGTFYASGDSFYIFDNMLQTYDSNGNRLHNTMITLPPGIGINEIAKVNDNTIVAAFVSQDEFQDQMPKELRPCGFLESIKEESFTEPQGQLQMRDREESSTIAFVEDDVLYPIYLDEYIVQPITNGIIILDYDMKIQKVIESEFKPLLASCGNNTFIYLAAIIDNKEKILGINLEGGKIFENNIPPAIGRIASPPLVTSDGTIFWVGTGGFVKYDETGQELLVKRFMNESDNDLYPVLYNDVLVVAFGNKIEAYDNDGEILYSIAGISGKITSPFLSDGNENYFIGSDSGLYSIVKK